MYALLAHMRETPEQTKQVVFSIRSMTCFNGFNTHNAFDFEAPVRSLMCTLSADLQFSGEYVDNPRNDAVRANPGYSQWECLGIGWLDYYTYAGEDVVARMARSPKIHERSITAVLNDARCSLRGSSRVLTPNETILARIFEWFKSNSQRTPEGGTGSMLRALKTMVATRYMAFDFVGSERPSGQAVAYLQVFRNLSQESYNGWTTLPGMLDLAPSLNNFRVGNGRIKSLIPLLSCLFNHGSDSDILSFAGTNVCSYMCQHGFWEHPELFSDPRSMLVEGRYNKGNQSARLQGKFEEMVHTARRNSGNTNLWPTSGTNPFAQLKASINAVSALTQLMSRDQVNLRIGRESHQTQYLENLTHVIRTYWSSNPTLQVQQFREFLNTLPDVSRITAPTRTTPELPTDGAGVGFRQWVENETIH